METTLTIRDDGVGFAPAAGGNGGLGLASLKERAEKIRARLKIESSPGAGTEITVIVPSSSTQEPMAAD
jgi:signal transduction histidine kinase